MPWTKTDYSNALKNLPRVVRNKAIDIANALFEKGNMEKGRISATAINHAKTWVNNRGGFTNIVSKKSKNDLK